MFLNIVHPTRITHIMIMAVREFIAAEILARRGLNRGWSARRRGEESTIIQNIRYGRERSRSALASQAARTSRCNSACTRRCEPHPAH